eukprot:CAMPEP_0115016250 /NCGR_PEP_ID=MMETSP0216-20121206/27309_1 /TAXON_ID=223996 /ORGANISM="Protocruzia adherens, Strain Boccale" /LENGTH=287 /DNA_ID=CAMNT_0002386639 /DNA_START=28 /DNA_END=891 /DNA_ORIENTATION=+
MSTHDPILFVNNIPLEASRNEVLTVFSGFGKVQDVYFNRPNTSFQTHHRRSCTVRVDPAFDVPGALAILNSTPCTSLGQVKLHVSAKNKQSSPKNKSQSSNNRTSGSRKAEMKLKQSLDNSKKFNQQLQQRSERSNISSKSDSPNATSKQGANHLEMLTSLLAATAGGSSKSPTGMMKSAECRSSSASSSSPSCSTPSSVVPFSSHNTTSRIVNHNCPSIDFAKGDKPEGKSVLRVEKPLNSLSKVRTSPVMERHHHHHHQESQNVKSMEDRSFRQGNGKCNYSSLN